MRPRISSCSMDITFSQFNILNETIKAYAVIITTAENGSQPPSGILSKTYDDFKNNQSNTYVACIIMEKRPKPGSSSDTHGQAGHGKNDPETKFTINECKQSCNARDQEEGKERCDHMHVNGLQVPETSYRVSIAGFSDIIFDQNTGKIIEAKSQVSFTNFSDPASPEFSLDCVASVIGGVGGGFAVICVLIVGIFYWRRKRKFDTGHEDYEDFYRKMQVDNNRGFIEEFNRLETVGVLQARSVASHPSNKEKNRPDASYPYDKTRVTLSTIQNSYINASYVPGYRSQKEFIVAQHPLPGTMNDFWYMIWEKRINPIVMLSCTQEDFKGRGEEYWPTSEAKTFGDIMVGCMSGTIQNGWTVREFVVRNIKSTESHRVQQFHFTDWPESGVSDNRHMLFRFLHKVRSYKRTISSRSPTLVHCRVSSGRCGIFIALHCIMNQLEDGKSVNVYKTVHDMLLHRPLMVQTEAQYIFLHRCTLDLVKLKKNVIEYENLK